MVTKIVQRNTATYQCTECGFFYQEKAWADQCEAWCKAHHSCNIAITKHALFKP